MDVGRANVADALRQTESAIRRSGAAYRVTKALKRKDSFRPVWDSLGGAPGVARLMAEFSVRDVRQFCRALSRTAGSPNVREERRAALEQLLKLLYSDENAPDQRPLRTYYQDIVPACGLNVIREWEADPDVEWTESQEKRLFLGHRELAERRFLERIFSPGCEYLNFETERKVYQGNLPLCEEILQTLIDKPEREACIPPTFVSQFVMPLLKRLLRRRYNEETRRKFLGLVVQGIQKHQDAFAGHLNLSFGGLVQFVMERYIRAPEDASVEHAEECLAALFKAMPNLRTPSSIHQIRAAIDSHEKLDPETRYELLRMMLRHMQCYNIDIDDGSEASLAKLKAISFKKNTWPVMLFFSLPSHQALRLLNRLEASHPKGDFISSEPSQTVLAQRASETDTRYGDVEILKCLLIRRLKPQDQTPGWLQRARDLIDQRKKLAQGSGDQQDRGFWSKSAMSLSVAAGDLDTLRETTSWARRYTKDPLTARTLFGTEVFGTTEIADVLAVIPAKDTANIAGATPVSVEKDIVAANEILLNIHETLSLATREPGYSQSAWQAVLSLPRLVVNRRLKNAPDFYAAIKDWQSNGFPRFRSILELQAETVWKPTMEALINIEALLRSQAIVSISRSVDAPAAYILPQLSSNDAQVMVGMVRFLLDLMKTRLGPETMGTQMGLIVEVIAVVTHNDYQPELAFPLIHEMLLDGGDNSSWHRQILTPGTLSSLPAKKAKGLLSTIVGAMTDALREQNLQWATRNTDKAAQDARVSRPPRVKVTTVKMMADLLRGNVYLSPAESCELLVGLLSEARHVDALSCIVNSLISMMEEPTCADQLRTRILGALKTYIVPVATQLSERDHMTESDWEEAWSEGSKVKLPEVGKEVPLFNMLALRTKEARLRPEDKAQLIQLVMDILEQSAVNNQRLMQLFRARNSNDPAYRENLAVGPVNFQKLASVLEDWTNYMPKRLFDTIQAVVLVNLDPPPSIEQTTRAVKANADLHSSNAGRHWLAHFDRSSRDVYNSGIRQAILALQRPARDLHSELEGEDGVSAQMLREFVLAAMKRLAHKGDVDLVYHAFEQFASSRFHSKEHWDSWQAHSVPMAKLLMVEVEAIRERQRQTAGQSSSIVPALLPNATRLQIMTLPMPYSAHNVDPARRDIDDFIEALLNLVNRIVLRRLPYQEDLEFLKKEVRKMPRKEDLFEYAVMLDEMAPLSESTPDMADYVRLELCTDFLSHAANPEKKQMVRKCKAIVMKWKTCPVEDIRAMGFSLEKSLEVKLGKQCWSNADIEK